MTTHNFLKNLGIVVLTTGLVACNGAEERKAKYMEEGKQLFQAGDYEKAQLAFKNVLQIDPKDAESRFQMAEALSKQGKIEAAFKEYSGVVASSENHVMARVRVGQLLLLNRMVDDAEKMVGEALAKEPDNVEALVLLAGVQSAKNNNDGAIASVERALKQSPDDVPATLMMASIQTRLDKTDQAIALLQQAIAKKTDNVPLRSMLAGLYAKTQNAAEAENTLAEIVKIEPQQLQHYRSLALFQVGTQQVDKAEATLRSAVAQMPDNDTAKTYLIDFLLEKRGPEVAIAELLPMIEQKPEAYELKFKLANIHLAKKEFDKTEATLKEIVDRDKLGPNAITARNKLAALYALTKRGDEAKALIKEVLENNPRDAEALTMRGQFALAENRIPDAIADFRAVLVDQPNNTGVLKMLAAAHLRNNEDELARENMEKVVSLAPADETAQLDLVGLFLKGNKPDQAKQQLETLLKANPKSLKGLEALFKLEVTQKHWDKAQAAAKQVQDLNDKDATGFYMSGLAYQAENKLAESVDAFSKALERKPDAVEPLTEMVKSYLVMKQSDKALAKLQQIVKQQPDHFVAYNLIGGAYLNEQKFAEAKAAYQKAESIKPDWYSPYRNLALIELAQKNKAGAIDIYKKGIEKTGGAMELVDDLARLYHRDGQNQEVLALYEASYKQHPDSAVAVNNLASYLSDFAATPENLERAAKLAEPLLKTNNPNMLDTVAWIAYKQGNYDKAKEIMTKAIERDAQSPISNYHMGMIYYKTNDPVKAREYLQKAVDKKVEFDGLAEAKEVLGKL
ncbi:tetratricopeptide repeat protein [Methylomonas sp. EFPC3]|uniref:tetratricopeptide repeat protein n=1 Tax=Methylomonas sp. EFPC3 TaxID=3021710 RepID=UPI002416000E|nr:tetratricopeptide repeat protein [Methylomonas sp. EFPC3]WFP51100.1 tetratricopeptide repeat protein [Methylomonas sp. EFPC3]